MILLRFLVPSQVPNLVGIHLVQYCRGVVYMWWWNYLFTSIALPEFRSSEQFKKGCPICLEFDAETGFI